MSRLGKGIGTPIKMDENVWKTFFDYLEKFPRADCSVNLAATESSAASTSATSPTLNVPLTTATKSSINSEASIAETSYLCENYELGGSQLQEQNIVVLSDSDTDDEPISSKSGYTRLREKARCLVFHRFITIFMNHLNGSKVAAFDNITEDHLFPYERLKELRNDLQKFQQEFVHNEKELTLLWNNVVQWLSAVKLSLDPMDLNNEQFNLILIDFMVQYLNYVTSIFCNINDEKKIEEKVSEVVQRLTVILNGNVSHVLMVLLRIDLKYEYRSILVPIFRTYLTDRNLRHTSNDLVIYLRIIFCFKRWKMITPVKSDREAINEIAVGKSMRALKHEGNSDVVDLTSESILPKSVPRVNVQNESFISISDLIGFAIKRKTIGTRILLVYTILDLEKAISKYFQVYERYVSRNATVDVLSTLCRDTNRLHMGGTTDPNMSQYQNPLRMNSNDGSTCQPQRRRERKSNDGKASQHLLQHRSTFSQPHLHADCDTDKSKNNSSISTVSNLRHRNTNTQSDITLSSKRNSSTRNLLNTSIDLTMALSSSDEENNVGQISNTSNKESENTQSSDSLERPLTVNENILVVEHCMPRIAAIPPPCRPLRKEKNCIPGEVSSTTSPDFVLQNNNLQLQNEECSLNATASSEQSSIAFGFNQSVLEVHSAGGTLQTGREVGVVQALQHHIDPCPPANQRAILLGLYYDDVSSDEEHESGAKSQNLSHKNWKVVKEATSSTSEFPKVSSNNVIFSTRLDRAQFQGQRSETCLRKHRKQSSSDDESESFQTAVNRTNESNLPDLAKTIFTSHDRPTCSKYIQSKNSCQRKENVNQAAIPQDITVTINELTKNQQSEILQTSHACIVDVSKSTDIDKIDDVNLSKLSLNTTENQICIINPKEVVAMTDDHLNILPIICKTSTETQIIIEKQQNVNLPSTTDVPNKQVVNEIIQIGMVNKTRDNSESQIVKDKENLDSDFKKIQTPAEVLNSSFLSVKSDAKHTEMDKENKINLNKPSTGLMVLEAEPISKQKCTKFSTEVELSSTAGLKQTQLGDIPQKDFSIEPNVVSKITQVSGNVSDICEINQINTSDKDDFIQNDAENAVESFEKEEIYLTKELSTYPALLSSTDQSTKTNNTEKNSSYQPSISKCYNANSAKHSTELLDSNNTTEQKDIQSKKLISKNTDSKHNQLAPKKNERSFILETNTEVCNAESNKKILTTQSAKLNMIEKEGNNSRDAEIVATNFVENKSTNESILKKTTQVRAHSSEESTQDKITAPEILTTFPDQSIDTEANKKEKQKDMSFFNEPNLSICNQTDSSIYKNKDNIMQVEIVNEFVELSEILQMNQHTSHKRPELDQPNPIAFNTVVLESSTNINKLHSNTVSSESTIGKTDISKNTLLNESRFIIKESSKIKYDDIFKTIPLAPDIASTDKELNKDSQVVLLDLCNKNTLVDNVIIKETLKNNKVSSADENIVVNLSSSLSVVDDTEKSIHADTEKHVDDISELKHIEIVEKIKPVQQDQYTKDNGNVAQTPKTSLNVKNKNYFRNVFKASTLTKNVALDAVKDKEKNLNLTKKIIHVDDKKDVDKIKTFAYNKTERVVFNSVEKQCVEKQKVEKELKFNVQKYSTPSDLITVCDQEENKLDSLEVDKIIESTKTSIVNNLQMQTNQKGVIIDMDINKDDNKNQTTEFSEWLNKEYVDKNKDNVENMSKNPTESKENKSELLKVGQIVDTIETSILNNVQSQVNQTAAKTDIDINKGNQSETLEFSKTVSRDPTDQKENKLEALEAGQTMEITETFIVNNVKDQSNQTAVNIDMDINKSATKNETTEFCKPADVENVEKNKLRDEKVSRDSTDQNENKLEALEVAQTMETTETSIVNNVKNQSDQTAANINMDIIKSATKNKTTEFCKPADVECVEKNKVGDEKESRDPTDQNENKLEALEVAQTMETTETSIVNNVEDQSNQTAVNIDMDINKSATKNETTEFCKPADVEYVDKNKVSDETVPRATVVNESKSEILEVNNTIEATETSIVNNIKSKTSADKGETTETSDEVCIEKNIFIEIGSKCPIEAKSKKINENTKPNNDTHINANDKKEKMKTLSAKFTNKECIRTKIIEKESMLEVEKNPTLSTDDARSYNTKNNAKVVKNNTNVKLDKNVTKLDKNLKEGDNSHTQLSSVEECSKETRKDKENLLNVEKCLTSLTESSSSEETDSNKNDETEELKEESSDFNKESSEADNIIVPLKSNSDEINAFNKENTTVIGDISKIANTDNPLVTDKTEEVGIELQTIPADIFTSTPVEKPVSSELFKPFSKLQLSIMDGIKQRTPGKMHIERRFSRGFVEFNLDSDEDEHKSDTSLTSEISDSSLQSKTVNFPNVLKDAEELALNISKLDLKKNRTESGSDSNHCEDNFIGLEDAWFRNFGLFKNKRSNLTDRETNKLNIRKNEVNQELETVNKPNLDNRTKPSFDQMPTSYKEEEIVAVTALMNMQNKKYQNKADINMLPTTKEVSNTAVVRPSRAVTRKFNKVTPEYITITNDDVVISDVPPAKVLKSAFKSKTNVNAPKKKVTYDEQNLEDNKVLQKSIKNEQEFKNKSEKYHNAEVKKKVSKKSVRERLAEINKQFKSGISLMSGNIEDLSNTLINDGNHIVKVAEHCEEIVIEAPITAKNIDEKQSMDTQIVKPGRGRKKKNINNQDLKQDKQNNSVTQITKNKQNEVTAECIYPVRLTSIGSTKSADTLISLSDANIIQTEPSIKPNNMAKCKSMHKTETVAHKAVKENSLLIVPDVEENPNKKRKFETKKAVVRIKRIDLNKKNSTNENKLKENITILKECQIKQEPIEETELILFQPNNVQELSHFGNRGNNTFKGKSGCREIIVRPCDIILTEDIINAQADELKKTSKMETRQLYKRYSSQKQAAVNVKLEIKDRTLNHKTSKILTEDVSASINLSVGEFTEKSLENKNVKTADISVETNLVGNKRKTSLNDKRVSNDLGITTVPEKKLIGRRIKYTPDDVETSSQTKNLNDSNLKMLICKTSKSSNNNNKSTEKVTDALDIVVSVEDIKISDAKSKIVAESKSLQNKTDSSGAEATCHPGEISVQENTPAINRTKKSLEITKFNQKVAKDSIKEKTNEMKSLKETTTTSEFEEKIKGDFTKTVHDTTKVAEKNTEVKVLENKAAAVAEITKTKTKDLKVGKTNKIRTNEACNNESNKITKDSEDNKKAFEVKTKVLTSKIMADEVHITTTTNNNNVNAEKSGKEKILENSAEAVETTQTKAKDTTVDKTNKINSLESKDNKKASEEKTKDLRSKNKVEKGDAVDTVDDVQKYTHLKSIAEAVKTTQRKTKDLSIGTTNKVANLTEAENTKVLPSKSRVETTKIIDSASSCLPTFDKNNEASQFGKVEKCTEGKPTKEIKVYEAPKTSKNNKSLEEVNKVSTPEVSVEDTDTAVEKSIKLKTLENTVKASETIQIISNELIKSSSNLIAIEHIKTSPIINSKDVNAEKKSMKLSADKVKTDETSKISKNHKKSFEETTKNLTSEIKLQGDDVEKSTENMTKALVSENKVEADDVAKAVEDVETAVEKKIKIIAKENKVNAAQPPVSSNSENSLIKDKTSDSAHVIKSTVGKINEPSIPIEKTERIIKAIGNAEPKVTEERVSIQSKTHVDPDDEIRKKLDHGIEMVFGNKNEKESLDISSEEGPVKEPSTQNSLKKLDERNSDITTEQLDRGIDAILGSANRSYQHDKITMENDEKNTTSKQKLGILTAQKINALFVERTKEKIKKSVFECDPEKNLIQSTENIFNKIKQTSDEECTVAKPSSRELETAKKTVSKKSFADVKIVSANVPDRVFADDESDNSSSADTSSHDSYFPSIPHDDVADNLKGDTVELPTNLEEANASNLETLALSSISDITTDPYFTSFPDILDQMLQSQTQAQETTDCMISGKNYVQKWTESSYSHESFKNKGVEETKNLEAVPIPVPSQNHNICIEQIFESNTNTIFFDEADVATNIGFDLDGNVTVEDLLAHDSDDLFPFSELDKSHSRSNSFSSDSEICTTPGNDACEEISHASKAIAYDHSYNKDAKEQVNNNTQIETIECIQGVEDVPSTSKSININEINKDLYKILDLDLGLSTSTCTSAATTVERRSVRSSKKPMPLQRKNSQELEKHNNENFIFPNKNKSPKLTTFKDMPFSRSKLNVNATVFWRKQRKEENSSITKVGDVSSGESNKNISTNIICDEVSVPTTATIIPPNIVSSTTSTILPITSPTDPPTTPKTTPPTTPSIATKIIEPVRTPPRIKLKTALPIIPLTVSTTVPTTVSTTTPTAVSTAAPTTADTALPTTATTENLTKDPHVIVVDVNSKTNDVPIKPIESDILTETSSGQINKEKIDEHNNTTMKRNCNLEITLDKKIEIVKKPVLVPTIEAPKINSSCQDSKPTSIIQSKIVKTMETHKTTPIQIQPIITIHSQTNRLQRIDQIPSQNAVNREYSISPCTRNESSKREHTPTLDEESFLEERNNDSTNSSNSSMDRSPFKRESTPTLDEPPQKKICLQVIPEKLSSNDIFDILKKEPPINTLVGSISSNEGNVCSDLNKILMPVSSPPHHSEEVTIETIEELKEDKLSGDTKKITSSMNVENEKIQRPDSKDQTVATHNPKRKNTKICSPEIVQVDDKDQTVLNHNQNAQNPENSIHLSVHKSLPLTKHSASFDSPTDPVETKTNEDKSKITKSKVTTSPSAFVKGSVKISPVLSKCSSTETCNSKIDHSAAIKSTPNKTELSILSPQKSSIQTSTNNSKVSPNSSAKIPVAKLNPKEIATPTSTSTPIPTLNVNNRYHPYSNSPTDGTNNRNKYVYQRVPSLSEPKQTAKKERTQISNTPQPQKITNKMPPEQQTPNNISRNLNQSNISTLATNFKLSEADEKELTAKLKAYKETLPRAKIYREHVEQKILVEKHEEKLRLEKRLEYLEKEKQRQILQYKAEAQRLKRKASNESFESLYKKYEPSFKSSTSIINSRQQQQQQQLQQQQHQLQQQQHRHHQQQQHHHHQQQQKLHNRRVYVNKFSEIEKKLVSSRKCNSSTNETPLTTSTAWEPKAPSVDEIMEHLAKLKKTV